MLIISKELKEAMMERQNHRCCWCGYRFTGCDERSHRPTYEHVLPRSRGGEFDEENIVIACRSCNSARGNLAADGFLAIFQALQAKDQSKLEPRILGLLMHWHTVRLGTRSWAQVREAFKRACKGLQGYGREAPDFQSWLYAYSLIVSAGLGIDIADPLNNPERVPSAEVGESGSPLQRPTAGPAAQPYCQLCGGEFERHGASVICHLCEDRWGRYGYEQNSFDGTFFLTGGRGRRGVDALMALEVWLSSTFDRRIIMAIREEYARYRRETAIDGEEVKAWRDFIEDFRDEFLARRVSHAA